MSTTDVFTASGTWTCPVGVSTAWVRCWGGGGAGGGVTANPSVSLCGGGGAGGSFAEKTAYPVIPGVAYVVTVAATRTGSTGAGGAGNDTWFDNISTGVLAKGGAGGTSPAVDGASGLGGAGSTHSCVGDNIFAGGSGANGLSGNTSTFVGAGGGGAGSAAAGNPGSGTAGGGGGSALGGTGGNGRTTTGNGNAGSTYGGGGSGGLTTSTTDVTGGNGAAGRIEIEYTPVAVAPGTYSARVVEGVDVDITSAPAVMGGVTLKPGDVVLLTGQVDPTQNGPRTFSAVGAVLARDVNWDSGELPPILIQVGDYAGQRGFYTGEIPVVLDTTPLSWYFPPVRPSVYVATCPSVASGETWVVQHNLGSRYLLCQIARAGSTRDYVTIGAGAWVIERTSMDALTIRPPSSVAFAEYEIVIQRIDWGTF